MQIDGKLDSVWITGYQSQRSDTVRTVSKRGQLQACVTRQTRTVPRRRRIRRLAVSAVVLWTAAIVGGLPVYVRPQIDQLRRADAILVLGGYGEARYDFGLDLSAQGWAPAIVLSTPSGRNDPEMTDFCATPQPNLQLHCFVPDPPTTKGEAKQLRRLAEQYGWRTVIVVTFRPHISRARFVLEQCFHGDLILLASPTRISATRWAFEYVYQTAGYLRALLQPGC